jgi:hypothetical protein
MSKLDGKFKGTIFREKDGAEVPNDSYMIFLARDNAFPATLQFYRQECERLGADLPQLYAVDELIRRVASWRKAHPKELKIPDVDPGELSWEREA